MSKRILLDGKFFTYGDSLAQAAQTAGFDIKRFSFALEDVKQEKTQQNNDAYETAVSVLTSAYPPAERETWDIQRQEAMAWKENAAAATPWIDRAASIRGVPRVDYINRTINKIGIFSLATAFLTGRRQNIDDAIQAATKAADVDAIKIDYTLPAALQ